MNSLIKQLLPIFSALIIVTGCTKAKLDDDYPNGDPPPVPGGFVNSSQIAPSNLVGYWAFNGSLIDSVTKAVATNKGSGFSDGIKGQAYKGSDTTYATFNPSNALQNLHSFSISFWMNSPANTGAIGIFSLTNTKEFWGSLDIYQDNGGSGDKAVFKVHLYNANVPWAGQFTETKVQFNKWEHIAVTYDGATSKLNIYQDGNALGITSAGNPQNTIGPALNGSDPTVTPVTPYGNIKFINATAMTFGAFQFQTNPSLTTAATAQSWATNFAGKLDEFRIYDKALTSQEVVALSILERQGR
jgi:hypothetical protein